ncbi:MAG TPA: hypothetical protein GX714_17395 [Chloroflexi bacterium]|nr:hypothetical protein [Chloroflexota bacterium]
MEHPKRRHRVVFYLLVTAIAVGLYLAGMGIPELYLIILVVAWITFLRG